MCRTKVFSIVALVLVYIMAVSGSALGASYNEAPMLSEMVAAGELPPVEERLPENPLVIEPVYGIGEYGGTWNRYDTAINWSSTRMKLYGHSPVRLTDSGLGIAPNWVESWESSEDARVWTLHIRKGTKWSDGEPLTSEDFMFWWEDMVLNPDHSDPVPDMLAVGSEPASITAPDDFTLVIEFSQASPFTMDLLATYVNAGINARLIAPKHYLKQFHPDYSDEYTDMEILEERMEWWVNMDTPVLTEWMPVRHDLSERLILERNPYFYAVDPEENQLPYIDRMYVQFAGDASSVWLQWMAGEVDMGLRPYAAMSDLSMLIDGQEQGDYRVILWDSGSGTGPMFFWNWNHPDDKKRELYRTPEFRRALSHAMNRDRIRSMLWFGLGEITTGTYSAKAAEFNRTEEGQQLYREWDTAYVAYDPELAKALLDEIGIVDQNGDGWRQYPSGSELEVRIDYNAQTGSIEIQTNEMVAADWEAIGIKTALNPMDGSQLGILTQTASFDIHNSWEIGNGPNFWIPPHWIIPHDLSRWAPLYGSFYQQEQAGRAQDDDRAPRDRTPPWERPADDDPVRRLQKIYDRARVEVDESERDRLAFEVVRIHIDDGPFFLGTVREYPRAVIVKNNFHNVPEAEDLALGGFVNPWQVPHPAITNPAQYWISE